MKDMVWVCKECSRLVGPVIQTKISRIRLGDVRQSYCPFCRRFTWQVAEREDK